MGQYSLVPSNEISYGSFGQHSPVKYMHVLKSSSFGFRLSGICGPKRAISPISEIGKRDVTEDGTSFQSKKYVVVATA